MVALDEVTKWRFEKLTFLLNDRQMLFGRHQDVDQRMICDVAHIMTGVREKNNEDGDCDNK